MFGLIFCPFRQAVADTDPEEPNLICFFLNNALLRGYYLSKYLWPVITWRQGLMSTCLLQYEELTLGGADELPVKKKEGNVTFVLDQTGFFPLKGNGTVIFSLADNDLLYIPHKLTASLSPSVSSLLCSGRAGKAGVSKGLVLKSALFSVKDIICPFHFYFCLIRQASLYRFHR